MDGGYLMKPTMVVTADFTKQFNEVIQRFKHDDVLVGIPAETTDRKKDEDEGPINNATLLAINNFGSPLQNIPARPVMEIGIRKAQPEIVKAFKDGAVKALSTGTKALDQTYTRVGIIASQSVKKVINSQEGIEGPSEATLKIRESQGFKGTKSLIVTGQMRNAITYVTRRRRR